jgi:urea transport system permease protein
LLVNTGKSLFSESFPQLWLFAMGGLFIAVVVLFPDGLAGLWVLAQKKAGPAFKKIWAGGSSIAAPAISPTIVEGEES